MAHLKKLLLLALALQLVNSQRDLPSKRANEGDYPYQVQLRIVSTNGKDPPAQHCGGAILNTYLVLTAAHCVYPYIQNDNLDQIEVVAGEHDLKKQSGHEQVVQIHEAFVHKNYGLGAKIDDIALLLLRPELNFNEFVKSIPIPKNVSNTGNATLSGWGRRSHGSKSVTTTTHWN
ncbi:unnamed protein product [Allacma fusca]|uniref:Peptidase S1 domain-containing protein n=1 Tax=Allacma fusca TaxID=39272 RepID=A0A8J2NUE9_9HEXA|nr:unnamed protein product [Allacma fusca]